NLPWRPAGISVDVNKRRLRRPYSGSDFRWIVGAEVRPEYRRIAKPGARRGWGFVRQKARRPAIPGGFKRKEVWNAIRKERIVGRGSINDAGAAAEDGFGIDLISNPQPRPQRPRIVVVEMALAGCFIDDIA